MLFRDSFTFLRDNDNILTQNCVFSRQCSRYIVMLSPGCCVFFSRVAAVRFRKTGTGDGVEGKLFPSQMKLRNAAVLATSLMKLTLNYLGILLWALA